MKKNLRLGDNHALWATNHKRNFEESCVWTHAMAPARSGPGLALGMLLLSLSAFHTGLRAQPNANQVTESDRITPLQIGDTIPDALWNMTLQTVNHPQGRETIKLADYKDKLIILDFWATWCTSCIKEMPKMQQLQKRFAGDVAILATTYEAGDRVQKFIEDNATLRNLEMASIVDDSTLPKIFEHRYIPHNVWIGEDGRILATTTAEQVTASDIDSVLSGKPDDLRVKKDVDRERPLFISNDIPPYASLQQYSILVKGKVDGLSTGSRMRKTGGSEHGIVFSNLAVPAMYKILAKKMMPQYAEKRFFIEPDGKTSGPEDLYSFDFILPVEYADSLYSKAVSALNGFSPYTGRIIKRKMRCLILTATPHYSPKPATSRKEIRFDASRLSLRNQPMSLLAGWIDNYVMEPLVIDETGVSHPIDIDINLNDNNPETLRKELNRAGFDFHEETRWMDVFVVSQTDNH